MSETTSYADFNTKQDGIYQNSFAARQAQIPEKGLTVDVKGTQLQSGFLVAWRPPQYVAEGMLDYSLGLATAGNAVLYGHSGALGLDNAHVTLSDHNVVAGRSLDHRDDATAETLAGLTAAVKAGIDNAGGARALSDVSIQLNGLLHNGSVAIIPGQAGERLHVVRNSVIQAAGASGIEGFNGTWGAHSTVSRVLEAPTDSREIPYVMRLLDEGTSFGTIRPASLDVGYFNTDPINGFAFTPVERFDVSTGTQFSMYSPGNA
jgi:hypothetical protein